MSKTFKTKQQGFTLLELLIVMIIVAILAGMGLVAFGTAQLKARDNRRKQDLSSIVKALETFYNDFGRYPNSSSSGRIMGCTNGTTSCTWGSPWQTTNGTLYMNQLPKDPVGNYGYFYQTSGTGYYLFAFLENEKDPDAAKNGSTPTFYDTVICKNALASTCNYVVKSTNLTSTPTKLP